MRARRSADRINMPKLKSYTHSFCHSSMYTKKLIETIGELIPYGKYEGTFPKDLIRTGETIRLEWKPSKAQLFRGHPAMAILLFPGSFSIPFMLLIPLLTFLGLLGWVLENTIAITTILIMLIIIFVYGMGLMTWLRTYYAVTEKAVYIKTGALLKRVYRTEWENVVDVKVKYSPFERITKCGTLIFKLKKGNIRKHPKIKWFTVKDPERMREALMVIKNHRHKLTGS